MDLSVFIQGIIIGLTLAVPIGPISLLCIQRTIADGRLHGIISGLGVSTADSFYAAITVLGLTVISSLIIAHQYLFRSLAGIILILIGIRVFMLVPSGVSQKSEHETYLKDYLSMVGIAIANPMTLVFFLVILPGFGVIIQESAFVPAAEFVAGVFFGSAVWWIILCGSVGSVRSRISIQRTIADGRLHGIISGLGVSTADSFYAAITVLGLTVISSLIIAHQYLFRSLAGIILILIGIRVFMLVPSGISQKSEHETYLKDYLSMAGIAIANPMTLVFFLVILPGFGVIIQESAFVPAAEFVTGVFFGSAVWWIFLCGSVGSVRSRISVENLRLINRISGILISCFGAGMLILLVVTTGQFG